MAETVAPVAKPVSRPRSRKPASVSGSALALHLDCSRACIGKLEAEGVIHRQGDGFPLDQSRVAYLRDLRCERRQSPRTEADAAHAKVKDRNAAARLMEKKRELVRRNRCWMRSPNTPSSSPIVANRRSISRVDDVAHVERGSRACSCGWLTSFIFVMTGVVYETQRGVNPGIHNYADALYFTVTALTTTGFGDITLPGTPGRLITVVIMIFGVTLFLNLAKVLVSPSKVRFRCPSCGLLRHDIDAVHCKACGTVLNIPDEGAV